MVHLAVFRYYPRHPVVQIYNANSQHRITVARLMFVVIKLTFDVNWRIVISWVASPVLSGGLALHFNGRCLLKAATKLKESLGLVKHNLLMMMSQVHKKKLTINLLILAPFDIGESE